ncbi:MAG: hypothetical protein A4E28_02432 [Methanocella sp. PtaU1.Bin125]|nr:MAG: hypothetical protein A4E28_02432 [Methanocella sp. PtaU1.Bin125]
MTAMSAINAIAQTISMIVSLMKIRPNIWPMKIAMMGRMKMTLICCAVRGSLTRDEMMIVNITPRNATSGPSTKRPISQVMSGTRIRWTILNVSTYTSTAKMADAIQVATSAGISAASAFPAIISSTEIGAASSGSSVLFFFSPTML